MRGYVKGSTIDLRVTITGVEPDTVKIDYMARLGVPVQPNERDFTRVSDGVWELRLTTHYLATGAYSLTVKVEGSEGITMLTDAFSITTDNRP